MGSSASFISHTLQFKFPAGTSRGVLTQKQAYYLILRKAGKNGIGECSTIPGLSIDSRDGYLQKLEEICDAFNGLINSEICISKEKFPSIAFGLETALKDIEEGGKRILYPGEFTQGTRGIPINGLVWMGERAFMEKQIREKIDQGFRCIKLKVGALDFSTEIEILSDIRKQFNPDDIELRLDANGAFFPDGALEKLKRLSEFTIHSIEQPIQQGQHEIMAEVCEKSPIPVALDEELIGITSTDKKEKLLKDLRPKYIILKPSLIGGFVSSEEWISLAKKMNIAWWITSALESNIGLNAIAQWTDSLGTTLPQGLGTGQLYTNNIPSPLTIRKGHLYYDNSSKWDLSVIA